MFVAAIQHVESVKKYFTDSVRRPRIFACAVEVFFYREVNLESRTIYRDAEIVVKTVASQAGLRLRIIR